MKNRIERIDYYKRSAFSISLIDHVRIERTKHGASIYLNGSPIRDITVSEYSSMEKTITDLFSKAYQEKYCAFDYEVQKENFELKFYLRLSYSDCIYHGLCDDPSIVVFHDQIITIKRLSSLIFP